MELPELKIGNLTIELPIVQGGMGVGVSKAGLAAAVSKAGGLGVIASVGLGDYENNKRDYEVTSRQALVDEIRKVKDQNLPVGVNIMVALSNYTSLVAASVEAGADVIFSGAGLPLKLPGYVKDSEIKLVPIVSSGRAAALICKTWLKRTGRLPDAMVVEGPLAGGHLGFSSQSLLDGTAGLLESLADEVIRFIAPYTENSGRAIPVIAAGGIYTGQDIARFLNIGAAGVQMGTRFVGTYECDAHETYKQAYINAEEKDIVVIQSPVGLPARVIRNAFVDKSLSGVKQRFSCEYRCLLTCDARKANYCIGEALSNSSKGVLDEGFVMCGKNAHRVRKLVSVPQLFDEVIREAGTVDQVPGPDIE
jgi:nitronate monooxygenase